MSLSLGEIAQRFGCELIGDPGVQVATVAALDNAGASSLSFLASQAYKPQLAVTRAAAVILRAADADDCPTACLLHDNPYACYALVAGALHPPPAVEPGIHERASVSRSAKVATTAQVCAHVTIGDRVTIGEHCYIGPGSVLGDDCIVGPQNRFLANVTLVGNVTVGARCIFHPGAIIGSDGFGNAMTPEGWVKVPQLGGVRIGNDVEIGANTTIDRGAIDDTVLDDGVRLDNLVHVAHNVRIGAHTAVAAQCGFSGSAVIGKRCMFAGQSGTVGHITVCDDVIVSGKAMVSKSITEPGVYASNFPAEPARDWNRNVARVRRLENLIERVSKLEKGSS